MTIQEAIKSGKLFKRCEFTKWMLPWGMSIVLAEEYPNCKTMVCLTVNDILATDWEVKQ